MTELSAILSRLEEIDPWSVVAITNITRERLRQIEWEGWSPEWDDHHAPGELALAGAVYASARHTWRDEPVTQRDEPVTVPERWPFSEEWWKPGSRSRNWIKGAALIVAELARWGRGVTALRTEETK